MKLVEMKCSRCGAVLKLRKDGSEAKCDFCGAIYKIDDEDHNAEQRGYEAEKGRIRAREEAKAEAIQERIDKINEAVIKKDEEIADLELRVNDVKWN